MTFIPTVDAIRVAIEGTWQGNQWVLTLWLGVNHSIDVSDLSNAVADVSSWYAAKIKPLVVDGILPNSVRAVDQSTATSPSHVAALSAAGSVATGGVANNTPLVVTFRTANRGRSSRGRNYVPGAPANQGSSAGPGATFQANLLAAYQALNSYLNPDGLYHAVVSHYALGHPRGSGFKQAVTEYSVDSAYDSQRRRLTGRGA